MSVFKYSEKERELNKILKMNQDKSKKLLDNKRIISTRNQADTNIASAEELLKSLGFEKDVLEAKSQAKEKSKNIRLHNRPQMESWEQLIKEANQYVPQDVALEELLSQDEIHSVFKELDEINKEFSRKTSIINKTDMSFLFIAIALQVTKTLIFPYVAEKFVYGNGFDASERLAHNDKGIEKAHKEANDKFKEKKLKKHETGHWINLLYQTPAYDITVGSGDLGINMGGRYHRLHTLGHDPILGWLFGTANILTDVITLNNFQSYRVTRKPKIKITPERVPMPKMFGESYRMIQEDFLNLPAAVFAQAQHLKSDVFTKQGLPVPLLETFNEGFASKLYKNQYDALCLARDMKIIGSSYVISSIIDIIIGLVHGLFREKGESKDLFEVRTRKILLLSNSIATSSSIVSTCITKNPKNLDIGSLLSTVTHLFTDIRFISKIKAEFIQNEIDQKLQRALDEVNHIYNEI